MYVYTFILAFSSVWRKQKSEKIKKRQNYKKKKN